MTGTIAVPNQELGIWDDAESNNTIGGTTAGSGNVIAANGSDGVSLYHVTADLVAGNWIGSSAGGSAALGNQNDGVDIAFSSAVTIGGTASGAGNLISANSHAGVEINDSTTTIVQGNLIGLDQTGTLALGNAGAGVLIDAGSSANIIGGAVSGARNFISGNAEGVVVQGAATTSTLIAGNLIGTSVKGTASVRNSIAGIELSGGSLTTVGGTTVLARNIISGNTGNGLDVESGVTATLIVGNFIGLDQTGANPLGNNGTGISIDRSAGQHHWRHGPGRR